MANFLPHKMSCLQQLIYASIKAEDLLEKIILVC